MVLDESTPYTSPLQWKLRVIWGYIPIMGKTLAYLRTSTDKQDLNNQRLEILEYARQHALTVDDFIEISISSRKSQRARRIEELLEKLASEDTLLVTELSRLGRSTGEVISLIDELIANDITIIVINSTLSILSRVT